MNPTHYAMLHNADGAHKIAEFTSYDEGRQWVCDNADRFRGMLGVWSAKVIDAPRLAQREIPNAQVMALFGC